MKIQILQVARSKDKNILALEEEFEKRLRPFMQLESITVAASKSDEREKSRKEESQLLLKKLDSDAHIIAMDERGSQLSSEAFADLVREQRDHGPGRIQFIIGGSNGLHETVLAKAHATLSLSKMTFTHEMVRVFLKEQLYRAATILAGKRYHK